MDGLASDNPFYYCAGLDSVAVGYADEPGFRRSDENHQREYELPDFRVRRLGIDAEFF